MNSQNNIITEKRLAYLRERREASREKYFAELVPVMGGAAVDEVRKIYAMFTEKMLIWYAGLWEPSVGGFYFSNSARDNEGFLPDIESTAQAVDFITEQCDLPGDGMPITKMPERFSKKISDFAYSLQDEDGYFYHPQWGKNITATRRGRDAGWSWRMIEPLGRECKYLRSGKRTRSQLAATLPENLKSIEAFRAWLENYPIETKSYPFGNYINSTSTQIKNAGQEYVDALISYLARKQNPENGLWEPQTNYASVNGLMKLAITYPCFDTPLPNAERAFESARSAVVSDEPVTFSCEFYNAWAACSSVLKSMEKSGKAETAAKLRRDLLANAPEMIRRTGEKMAETAVGDGSFAYFTAASGKVCHTSQGAPVALDNVREGDVNGNGCSTRAPLSHMFGAFGVKMPPMFCPEDAELVFELMDLA